MDLTTSVYGHTMPDSVYPLASCGPRLNAEQKNTFLSQIVSTIDISALGSLYYHQLRQHVSLVHLNLSDAARHLAYGRNFNNSDDSCAFSLPLKGRANDIRRHHIRYTFSAPPSREERHCVGELHSLFAAQFAHALEFERLKQLATKDALTSLGNRSAFDEACTKLSSRAFRHDETFSLLVIDLDNFKQVNDTFGHQEGDLVLQAVAVAIRSVLRSEDESFRIGGDEFCCLIDCQDKDALQKVAERLHQQFAQNALITSHRISCSIGGAIYRNGDDIDSLFKRADSAMYQVKASGKNAYLAA